MHTHRDTRKAPPAPAERLARDRSAAARPPHMCRRALRAIRPHPCHLRPARRQLRAAARRRRHRCWRHRCLLERRHGRRCRRAARHCCCHTRCQPLGTCESRPGMLRAAAAWLPTRPGRRGCDSREAVSAGRRTSISYLTGLGAAALSACSCCSCCSCTLAWLAAAAATCGKFRHSKPWPCARRAAAKRRRRRRRKPCRCGKATATASPRRLLKEQLPTANKIAGHARTPQRQRVSLGRQDRAREPVAVRGAGPGNTC